jgi:dTMP kinase
MKILKNFVVFEGIDGSGTTTQLNILETFFLQNKDRLSLPVFYKTFEPTDGIIGRIIRQGLGKKQNFSPKTAAFLFAADRNEHLYAPGGIVERCNRGELVVSDRYAASSLVYQGITCGKTFPARLNRDFPGPELLLFFDLDAETAQKRMANRDRREIFEYLDFQIKVRDCYKALLPAWEAQGVRVETVNAALPPEKVAGKVWKAIQKMPIFKR